MKTYFASYHLSFPHGQAFGMGDFDVPHGEIETMADIKALAETIRSTQEGCTHVIILNWKEIKRAAQGKEGTA